MNTKALKTVAAGLEGTDSLALKMVQGMANIGIRAEEIPFKASLRKIEALGLVRNENGRYKALV